MEALRVIDRRSIVIVAIGAILVGVSIGAILLVASRDSELASAAVIFPILMVVSLPVLYRASLQEGDRRLFWFLVLALALKLTGAFVRYHLAFDVYEGGTDATSYSKVGGEIAERFRAGAFDTGLPDLSSTNFIRFLTGIVFTLFGSSTLGGFLLYSWLGFWGLFFFYRAFTIAVPEGRSRTYARLLFLLPSLLFWPSSIGKEAWMMFTLGIISLGVARVMSGRTWRGLAVAAAGMWLASLVRPHIAGLMGIALVSGFVLRRRPTTSSSGLMAKGLALAVLVLVAALLVVRTDDFLREKEIETERGLTAVLERTSEITADAESSFVPSILESPARAPVAIVTVLFRPLIFEAHNLTALAAALEMTFLLGLAGFRFRWAFAAIRSVRRQPYVAFALVYVGLFVVAFSGIANFGLLARERVQMLPLFLTLFSIPPKSRRPPADDEGPAAA